MSPPRPTTTTTTNHDHHDHHGHKKPLPHFHFTFWPTQPSVQTSKAGGTLNGVVLSFVVGQGGEFLDQTIVHRVASRVDHAGRKKKKKKEEKKKKKKERRRREELVCVYCTFATPLCPLCQHFLPVVVGKGRGVGHQHRHPKTFRGTGSFP